jgi:adenine/guanine/hypoxanthine permease
VIGILPGVGAWGAMMAKAGLRAGGLDGVHGAMSPALVPVFQSADVWIDGAFALEQGFIFTSMFLAAATVAVIERKLPQAALWCFAAAALSALGFMHAYTWTPADTVLSLTTPAWPFVQAYALMGVVFLVAPRLTIPSAGPAH